MQISEILRNKGTQVHTVRPDATVSEAALLLRDEGIGALVVSVDDKVIAGILSERDIVHALADNGADALDRPVTDYMTRDVVVCKPADTGRGVLGYMTERRMRHVPVVELGELAGMISIGDVVKSRLDEIMNEAEALRDYIAQS